MRVDLDALLEQVPREELEAELAAVVLLVEQVNGVDDLRLRHLDVDDTKVAPEAVAHEPAPEVQQDPEALVGDLERDEAVAAGARVQVAGEDARVLVEVVNNGLPHLDPVVNKGEAFILALATHDRNAAQRVEVGSDDLPNPVRLHLHFRLLGEDEFSVESHGTVWTGLLSGGIEDAVRMLFSIGSKASGQQSGRLWIGMRRGFAYFKSICNTDVSMFFTQSVSI